MRQIILATFLLITACASTPKPKVLLKEYHFMVYALQQKEYPMAVNMLTKQYGEGLCEKGCEEGLKVFIDYMFALKSEVGSFENEQCLTVYGYDQYNMPMAIHTTWKKVNNMPKLDSVHMAHDLEKLPDKVTCPSR
jgi:hypothetical protein